MSQIWRLKKGCEQRIRKGHPWVYAHELMGPIRNFRIQEIVELQDANGNFLARGYGNPKSKIIFRAMSFSSSEKNPLSPESIYNKLMQSWRKRDELGFKSSFRLCYSEADEIPGLIIDRFLVAKEVSAPKEEHQVFAVQILTAGIQKNISDVLSLLKKVCKDAVKENLSEIEWERTSVILRNDVKIRKLEGLEVEIPRFLKIVSGYEATDSWIKVKGTEQDLFMNCDLYRGQKTGFFLDQLGNISAAINILKQDLKDPPRTKDSFKILDLCSYVGHWSVQVGSFLQKHNISAHTTLVDASREALVRAEKNVRNINLPFASHCLDVLKELDKLPSRHYDLVIADPPAFVKSKKDIPMGKHAYMKLNSQAFRLVKSGGHVVSCSCSGLITEDDLQEAVEKAMRKNEVKGSLVARGESSADHPKLAGFFEGSYLKMIMNQIL